MLLEVFPEFHRKVDGVKRFGIMKSLGEQFLGFRETFELADAIESALQQEDRPQVRRLFDLLEKLVLYGDDYTRNASISRLFELLLQRHGVVPELEQFLLARTREKWNKIAAEMKAMEHERKARGDEHSMARSGKDA